MNLTQMARQLSCLFDFKPFSPHTVRQRHGMHIFRILRVDIIYASLLLPCTHSRVHRHITAQNAKNHSEWCIIAFVCIHFQRLFGLHYAKQTNRHIKQFNGLAIVNE